MSEEVLETRVTELENRLGELEQRIAEIEVLQMNMSNVNLAQMINMVSLVSALGRILVSKKIVTGEELTQVSKEEYDRLRADSEAFRDSLLKEMAEKANQQVEGQPAESQQAPASDSEQGV